MSEKRKYYLTTAIAYLNGKPHIGHAYEFIIADILVRAHKISGDDTYFLTGSDEHGQKMADTAEVEGLTPQELCDRNLKYFLELDEISHVEYDKYIRTTDSYHIEGASWLWNKVNEKGDIYLATYSGWYNVKEECFVTDHDAETHQYKDPDSGIPYQRREEESYFFRMSKYHDKVHDLIANTDFVQPVSRRNELLSRLGKARLTDLSISRSTFKWGIPVPNDPNHVMYVWFDALSNYLTGINYHDENSNLRKYWPANCHLIGKDIIWFHCVIWPAMLMAGEVPLPRQVLAHGFVQDQEGSKMSKSKGNVISPLETLRTVGPDVFRWYLAREASLGADLKFQRAALVDMANADLCATIGNLVHRAIALAMKACDGKIPEECETVPINIDTLRSQWNKLLDNSQTEQLAVIGLDVCRTANKYLTEEAPWKLDEGSRQRGVIRAVLEMIYVAAHFLQPFIPIAMEEVSRRLASPLIKIPELSTNGVNLKAGAELEKGEPLFGRVSLPDVADDDTAATSPVNPIQTKQIDV